MPMTASMRITAGAAPPPLVVLAPWSVGGGVTAAMLEAGLGEGLGDRDADGDGLGAAAWTYVRNARSAVPGPPSVRALEREAQLPATDAYASPPA